MYSASAGKKQRMVLSRLRHVDTSERPRMDRHQHGIRQRLLSRRKIYECIVISQNVKISKFDSRETIGLLSTTTGALYSITSGFGLAHTQAITMNTTAILEEKTNDSE